MRSWTKALILISLLILLLVAGLFSGLALAEIYCWIDDQGVQYYTTSLDNIPEPFRSRAHILPTPMSPPAPPELPLSPTQKGPTRIPFTPGSPVLVSARINGVGPITLILDTGSDRTLVAPAILGRLGISTESSPRAVIKGVTGTSDANAVWVNSVEVGEAKVGPLLIIAHDADLSGADGLLGRDFLAHFNVTIDSKQQVVTLAPN